ncbi:MAG TPA: polymer-forming cytoskeletal protein [Spirochaetales bacterium]|nr:polymer-forming cytoskeletal protein [Spirochaetales bacterium]
MARNSTASSRYPVATTLGEGTSFSGTLGFSESLRIAGRFEGEIDARGLLVVDELATVKARLVKASSVVVAGVVHADIEAADRVELLSTARVYGNVRTARLRIADGVVFEGRCEMIRDPDAWDPFSPAARETLEAPGGAADRHPSR